MPALVVESPLGLYCPQGDFYIDPAGPVPRAVLTHVHSDHAHPGAREYFCAEASLPLLKKRIASAPPTAGSSVLAEDLSAIPGRTSAGTEESSSASTDASSARFTGVPYGRQIQLGSATVSFHPAGHVLGSAQIRIEADGEVWAVSGDYKRAPDPTCAPFEVVPCDVFVTEATFALPIFRWDPAELVAREILGWWDANRENDKASVLICYSLGKAQRLLAELQKLTDRPVYVHGAIELITQLYRDAGVQMLPTIPVAETTKGQSFKGELILAPRSARGQTWMRRFGNWEEAFVSGWMRIRGTRRHMSYDRGFVLSDHADWPALLRTIEETKAKRVLCTHGYVDALSRYLSERGIATGVLRTAFAGEGDIA